MKTKHLRLQAGLVLGLIHSGCAQPVIALQPRHQTNVAGTTATFTVGATGAGPLRYQWILNSLANRLTGATNDTLVVTNVQAVNAGNYRVETCDEAGTNLSASARLTVLLPPSITAQPTNQIAEVGDIVVGPAERLLAIQPGGIAVTNRIVDSVFTFIEEAEIEIQINMVHGIRGVAGAPFHRPSPR